MEVVERMWGSSDSGKRGIPMDRTEKTRRLNAIAEELVHLIDFEAQDIAFREIDDLHIERTTAHERMTLRALRMIEERRRRNTVFGAEYFGEPAWDLLLELFVSHQRGERVAQKVVALGAQLPSSTMSRYIAILEQAGMVIREKSVQDSRVTYVFLSDIAVAKFRDLFGDDSHDTSTKEHA